MMEMKEQTGSRKKLLVPVVVLMLCLVTLTGAAYAYQSSLTVQDNAVDADYLSIDLATGVPSTSIASVENPGAIVFTDNYVYNGDVKKNTVNADITTKLIKTYNLKVRTDTTFDTVKVSSDDIATVLTQAVGSKTVGALFKIYVGLDDDGTDMAELTAAGTEFTVTQTAEETSVPVYVFVVVMDGSTAKTTIDQSVSSVAKSEYIVPNSDTNNAESLKNLFSGDNYKFNITFDAYLDA